MIARRIGTWTILGLLAGAAGAEVLDRIAVTIGKHVIAESEILENIRAAAFVDGKAPDLSGASKRAAAERMVEQYLVLEDAASTHAPLPGPAEADPLFDAVRMRYGSEAEFDTALERAGITAAELKDHLLRGLQTLRYTEIRFRPEVQLSESELRDYYDSLPAAARQASSFEDSRDKIETLLIEERVMQALDRWLGMARTDHQILYRDAAFQ